MTGITLILLAYRQEAYIEAALRGVLEQAPLPAELIINDDASPDGTAAVIERVLTEVATPMPVYFIRNESNIGLARLVNNAVGGRPAISSS